MPEAKIIKKIKDRTEENNTKQFTVYTAEKLHDQFVQKCQDNYLKRNDVFSALMETFVEIENEALK